MPKINVQIGSQKTTGSEIAGNKMPGGRSYSQEALDLKRALLKVDGFLAKIESGATINLSEAQRRELIEALSKVRNEHKGHLVLSKTHWLHDKHIRNAIDEAIETLKSGLSFETLRDYHAAPEKRTDTMAKLYQVLFNEHRSDTQDIKLKSNRGQAKPSEMIGAMKVLDDLLDEIEHNPSYKTSSAEKKSIEKALGIVEKYYDHPYRKYRPDSWKDARARAEINEARKALMSEKAFSGLRGPLNDDAELRTRKILDVYTRLFNDNKDLLEKFKAPTTRGSVDKRAEVYDIFCRIGNFISKIESSNEATASGRTRSQLINALETARKHYETNRTVRHNIDKLLRDLQTGKRFDAFRGPQLDEGEKSTRRLVELHSFLYKDASQGSWPASMIKDRGAANVNLDRTRALKELDALISEIKKFDNSPRIDKNLSYLPKQDAINSLKASINTLRRHYDGHLSTHERQGVKGKVSLPEKSDRALDAKYRRLIDQAVKAIESKDGFAIQRGPTSSKAEHNTKKLVSLFEDVRESISLSRTNISIPQQAKFQAYYDGFLKTAEGGKMSKRDAATDGSGATLWGVTQRTYQNYHKMHKSCKKCSHSVMQMTPQEHKDIFYQMYWKQFNIERLPPRVAWVVMDFAVNGGRPTNWKFEAARKIGINFSSTEDFYRRINSLSPQQEDAYLHKLIGLKANYYGEIIEGSFQRRKNAALKQGLSNDAAVLKAARTSLMRFHDGWQNRLIELACAVELEPNQDYFSTAYLVPRELKPPLNKRYGIDFGLTPNREGYLEAKVDGTPSLQQRYDDLKVVTKTKGIRLVNTGSNIGSAEASKEFKQAYSSLELVIRAADKNPNTSLKPQHINTLIVRLQKLRDYYKVGFLKNLGSGFNYGSMYRSLEKVLNLLEASSSNGLQLSSTNKQAFEELLSKLKAR